MTVTVNPNAVKQVDTGSGGNTNPGGGGSVFNVVKYNPAQNTQIVPLTFIPSSESASFVNGLLSVNGVPEAVSPEFPFPVVSLQSNGLPSSGYIEVGDRPYAAVTMLILLPDNVLINDFLAQVLGGAGFDKPYVGLISGSANGSVVLQQLYKNEGDPIQAMFNPPSMVTRFNFTGNTVEAIVDGQAIFNTPIHPDCSKAYIALLPDAFGGTSMEILDSVTIDSQVSQTNYKLPASVDVGTYLQILQPVSLLGTKLETGDFFELYKEGGIFKGIAHRQDAFFAKLLQGVGGSDLAASDVLPLVYRGNYYAYDVPNLYMLVENPMEGNFVLVRNTDLGVVIPYFYTGFYGWTTVTTPAMLNSTDDLPEGLSNKYWSDSRAWSYLVNTWLIDFVQYGSTRFPTSTAVYNFVSEQIQNINNIPWTSIQGKPTFANVATTGNYTDLLGRPALATVATTGKFSDLNDISHVITADRLMSAMNLYFDDSVPGKLVRVGEDWINTQNTLELNSTGQALKKTSFTATIWKHKYLHSENWVLLLRFGIYDSGDSFMLGVSDRNFNTLTSMTEIKNSFVGWDGTSGPTRLVSYTGQIGSNVMNGQTPVSLISYSLYAMIKTGNKVIFLLKNSSDQTARYEVTIPSHTANTAKLVFAVDGTGSETPQVMQGDFRFARFAMLN